MTARSGKFHSFLKKMITRHRKKRYQGIKQLSSGRSFIRAIVIMLECWIMQEKISWDFQYAKTQSPIERKLYNLLKQKGYRLKTQVPCGKYFIDIAIPRYKLAIECDGKAYHSSPEQKRHDERKNRYLRKNGWSVLRFSGSDINSRLGSCLSRIENKLKAS
ncbi:endonuclease domain-containing protein [Shimazuella kribbensis]|uniref:endonuclease domain-containing protein n=1 Tax=Shimazuella kribbensis TaxID=139808 RepID=UPI001FE1A06A|nr:DUF559 domain-containing protein [Shimazuella kribbensis]